MTIEELIIFCEEEEYNHRLKCKRYDDASGYARSKDKNIRTACAIREDSYADFYKEISDTMRKYQKIEQEIVKPYLDKIRAEISEYGSIMVTYAITKDTKTDKGIEKLVRDVLKQAKEQVLAMIDKYKAESEG